MADEFSSAQPGSGYPVLECNPRNKAHIPGQTVELKGRLLLVYPTKFEKDRPSTVAKSGFQDRITADVVVLDGERFPDEEEIPYSIPDMYFSQSRLVNQLKRQLRTGKPLLGRLSKLEAKQPGQYDAWTFAEPSDEDKVLARKWIENNPVTEPDDPFDTD